MHYKNGREAKNGDMVVMISGYSSGFPVVGILFGATPGNDACNGYLAIPHSPTHYANLSQCLHVDDVLKATIPDSTK